MPRLDVVGVIVSDLGWAVDFYKRLGVSFKDPDGDVVDLFAPLGEAAKAA